MRIYALMLGVALTTGYGYAAQVAVTSVGAAHRVNTLRAASIAADDGRGQVWYGGVLDPVVVESQRGTVVTKTKILGRPTVRCPEVAQSRFTAVS